MGLGRVTLRLTLDECGRRKLLHALPQGRHVIEYTDSTHTAADEWIKLAHVDVRAVSLAAADEGTEQFFTLTCDPGPLPSLAGKNDDSPDRRLRTLRDALALALGRVGLLTPEVTPELLEQLLKLDEEDGVIIVPDTNALHNGAVHWLLRVLRRPSVWLLPVVASLTTVQIRDAMVKDLVNQRKPNKLVQALRSRGLVNGALGLLQRNRGRCQVIEVDPSLLRYQKQSSSSGMDPDQSDVLEDRLIIEAIQGMLRSMRSRSARRVVTSDVNIARVLEAEGIQTLFVPTIILPATPIACLRFDALARTFIGAPLRALLWELTHVFGSVRLRREEQEMVRLECYWAGKTPAQWSSETLIAAFMPTLSEQHEDAPASEVDAVPAIVQATAPASVGESLTPAAKEESSQPIDASTQVSHVPPAPEGMSGLSDEAVPLIVEGLKPAHDPSTSNREVLTHTSANAESPIEPAIGAKHPTAESLVRVPLQAATTALGGSSKSGEAPRKSRKPNTEINELQAPRERDVSVALPRASLPQMLNLLAAANKIGPATTAQIVSASSDEPITHDNARRALEILKRVDLLRQEGEVYSPTSAVENVNNALSRADLDAVSSLMSRFAPYRVFLELMQRRCSIPRAEVTDILRNTLGRVGNYESERLPRFHILLGQAWTRGDAIMDGSQRPTDRDATDAFNDVFEASASDGIAGVVDLLPRFCEKTRMSPWAAKLKIEGFVRENLLSNYAFQTAAGRRPITRDAVLNGALSAIHLEPVVVDRLQLGQRPVFTIERRAL